MKQIGRPFAGVQAPQKLCPKGAMPTQTRPVIVEENDAVNAGQEADAVLIGGGYENLDDVQSEDEREVEIELEGMVNAEEDWDVGGLDFSGVQLVRAH